MSDENREALLTREQSTAWKRSGFHKRLRYALQGIVAACRAEKNFQFQLCFSVVVVIVAILLGCTLLEFAVLFVAIGLVLVAELFNTCLEALLDFTHPEFHEAVGRIKDISAGAVLTAAAVSVAVGLCVLGPRLWVLVRPWIMTS